ncbi:MAG: LamG-like jellyroll fold domain-containing protein, partial [Myxococcota bacterium]
MNHHIALVVATVWLSAGCTQFDPNGLGTDAAVAASDGSSGDTDAGADPSLVLHLKMDGDLLDSTPYIQTAMSGSSGITAVPDRAGDPEGALTFNRVVIDKTATLQTLDLTVALWLRLSPEPTFGPILGSGTDQLEDMMDWRLSVHNAVGYSSFFYFANQEDASIVLNKEQSSGWVHYAVTRDVTSRIARIFINGRRVTTESLSAASVIDPGRDDD